MTASEQSLIQQQVSLKAYNTLAIDVSAQFFAKVSTLDELKMAVEFAKTQNIGVFVLGEGSNLVLTADIADLVIKLEFFGIDELEQTSEIQRIRVGAGENWDAFVDYTIKQAWYGLENLSLIPGTVGASPVQNIGAYGAEVADVIAWVECFDLQTQQIARFDRADCQFGYRDSLFKRNHAQNRGYSRYVITHIVFDLARQFTPNVSYGALAQVLASRGQPLNSLGRSLNIPDQSLNSLDSASLSASQVRQAVIDIRSAKLPDPSILANAGSFFKNPVISVKKAHKIREQYSNMPQYPTADESLVKVAAAWLIEQAGWKGRCIGPVGMHEKQALVLVNHGEATANDVIELAKAVVSDVERQFGITLEAEPVHFPQNN